DGIRDDLVTGVQTCALPICAFTTPEPGTTMATEMFAALRRPLTIAAAARRSSMRELVHEPMNTLSSLMSVMRVRGLSPMYTSARSEERRVGKGWRWWGTREV